MSGGTITTTNGGLFGTLMSTPILNMPQSAILGLHKIQERPVAVAGKVEIRPMMYLALSYDHRIIDGREAVTFLVRVKERSEEHTSELQSLMRISYAVFCLKKKTTTKTEYHFRARTNDGHSH